MTRALITIMAILSAFGVLFIIQTCNFFYDKDITWGLVKEYWFKVTKRQNKQK